MTIKLKRIALWQLLLLLVGPGAVWAQFFPREGARLHFSYVGCSWRPVPKATQYELYITQGFDTTQQAFDAHKGKPQIVPPSKELVAWNTLNFNEAYTWQVVSTVPGKAPVVSALHHFSTYVPERLNGEHQRLRITQPPVAQKPFYVFVDALKALYSADGRLIWYLPAAADADTTSVALRDLKCTGSTLTFLQADKGYAINAQGQMLWKAPIDTARYSRKEENYHHELTYLPNGNYMIMGYEYVETNENEPKLGSKQPFTTLVEYAPNGKRVWIWHSSLFYAQRELDYPIKHNGAQEHTIHGNSFYFDWRDRKIYISFKNLSSIIAIQYPVGNLLHTYRTPLAPGGGYRPTTLFCEQHAIKVSKYGHLYLYNNNMVSPESRPTIALLDRKKDTSIRSIPCPLPEFAASRPRPPLTTGGNVEELPNGQYFGINCSPYGNVFIVDSQGNTQWQAQPEHYEPQIGGWSTLMSYRASILYGDAALQLMLYVKP